MESNNNPVSVPPMEDLVEEKKPTSLLVAQFFLFPLIIIGICVGIFLLFGYLTYEQRSAREYLDEIRTGSETRRWQAAYELSNIISSEGDRLRNTNFVNDVVAVYQSSRNDASQQGSRRDPRIRQFLALTMGHLGDPRAVPALVEGLTDPEVENQIYTLWALGSIGDNAAVPGILAELRNDDPSVRKVAAYVLGAIKDPRASRDLNVALNDPSKDVQWSAAIALAQMEDAAGADLLMQLLDRNYVAQLVGMTDEQKTELMRNAIRCLGILKFPAARDKIADLSRNDPDLSVRDVSLEALNKFQN
jgi:HEAT repeat protein